MKKLLVIPVVLFALCAVISGCGKSDVPGANQVWMQNTAFFTPATITVPVNTTITWTNKDAMTHNVTSDSGWFISGNVAPGATYAHQFTSAGTFTYRCTIHVGMTGKVIVQ
jgi:plastocyanin